jgi:hypothetical protein
LLLVNVFIFISALGREGWGLANYLNNLFPVFTLSDMAAKPLPATSQPAAPLPLGGSFGGNLNLQNTCGVFY